MGMTTIIAGMFEQRSDSDNAITRLRDAGFPHDQISAFYVSPPGQHDTYPVGGDQDRSPGAEDSAQGTAVGSAAGGAVGVIIGSATAPVSGPIGALAGGLVGAHIGNLVGALGMMKEDGDGAGENPIPSRPAGLLVAVSTPVPTSQSRAIAVLRQAGAHDIEQNEGTISQGDWEDFDPARPPQLIH